MSLPGDNHVMRCTPLALVLTAGCSLYFGDEPEPTPQPPDALPRCEPGPRIPGSTLAPDLHAWILEREGASCALERRTSSGAQYGFPTVEDRFAPPGETRCDAEGCWRALPAFARAWQATTAIDAWTYRPPLGEQWTGMIAAERHVDTGELRATLTAMQFGQGGVHVVARRWDAAGQLQAERTSFMDRPRTTVELSWQDGRPVSARYADELDPAAATAHTWRWDGGRLIASEVVHAGTGARATAQLGYDGGDRLRSIDRTVDGGPWTRQTWTYDAAGRVSTTTTEVDANTAPAAARGALATDDLLPLTTAVVQTQWDVAAGLAPTAAGCLALPHGLQHGYPEAEGAYALGYALDDRPSGIDVDYGFGNVYDTGYERWYGHDRVEAYPYLEAWGDAAVRSERSYDAAGRMVAERLTTADGAIDAARTRVFGGARLLTDRRVLVRDGRTSTTELRFVHDGDDRLRSRTLMVGDRVVGVHTWTHAPGRVASHTIAAPELALAEPGRTFEILDLSTLPPELGRPVVHERIGDATFQQWLRDGEPVGTRRRDAAGRVLERTDGAGFERFAYDADGRLTAFASGWDTTLSETLAYERGSSGDLLLRAWSYGDVSADRDVFTYACR